MERARASVFGFCSTSVPTKTLLQGIPHWEYERLRYTFFRHEHIRVLCYSTLGFDTFTGEYFRRVLGSFPPE